MWLTQRRDFNPETTPITASFPSYDLSCHRLLSESLLCARR